MDEIKVYDPNEDKFAWGTIYIKNPIHRKGEEPYRFKATNKNEVEVINNYLKNYAMEELNLFPDQYIKPMFDRDCYDAPIDTEYDIDLIKELIGDNCVVKVAMRPTRIKNGKTYNSGRYYVINKRIRANQLKDFIEMSNKIPKGHFDVSKYGKGGQFFTLYNNRKHDGAVPALVPFNDPNPNPLDYYATYVLKEYEDYDLKWEVIQVIKMIRDLENDKKKVVYTEDDEEVAIGKSTEIDDIIEHLLPKRADHYETWFKPVLAIINYGLRLKLGHYHIKELIHQFSKKSNAFYEEDKVDTWITNNFDRIKNSNGDKLGRNFLINTCLKEDDPKYWAEKYQYRGYEAVLNDLNKQCVKLRMMRKWLIFRKADKFMSDPYYLFDKDGLKQYYECESEFMMNTKDKDGVISSVNIMNTKMYWSDTKIKCYDNIIYAPCPTEDISDKYFNSWVGWECMKYDACNDDDKDVKIILNHLKEVWCDDNMELYEWWLDYLAYLVSGGRTGVVPIVRGTQGCGKDKFMSEFIMDKLLGAKYCISTDDPVNHIFGRFNAGLLDKSYGVIEEGSYDLNIVYPKIKKTATSDKLSIEKKFADVINAKNMINLIISTNLPCLITGDKGMDQRRLMFSKCSDRYVNNTEYFNRYTDAINNGKAVKYIYDMLVKRFKDKKLDPENTMYLQNTRPKTKETNDVKEKSIPLTTQFLLDKLDIDIMENPIDTRINRTTLYAKYRSWCESRGIKCCDANSFYTSVAEVDGLKALKSAGVRYMIITPPVKARLLELNKDDILIETLEAMDEWI
jgi:hypothetical protein